MSEKMSNISSNESLEAKTYALTEEDELSNHHLGAENIIIQDMCQGSKLFKVKEKKVSTETMKKLSDGKMVPTSAPVMNPGSHSMGGCSSEVVGLMSYDMQTSIFIRRL